MLMVIFGAGASYDCDPSQPPKRHEALSNPRLPLANELFEDRYLMLGNVSDYRQCRPIIPFLRSSPHGPVTVERVLEGYREEVSIYPRRQSQLAAIKYYLQLMVWRCQRPWSRAEGPTHGITNHVALLDQIEQFRHPQETVLLVTFNYDTLLETALESVDLHIHSIDHYISDPRYKLIKLHGSVNWGRVVIRHDDLKVLRDKPPALAHELIEGVTDQMVSGEYRASVTPPLAMLGDDLLFPAIAIPVETKKDYECPDQHLRALEELLPNVTKLLIIGWRGAEAHFLALVKKRFTRSVPGFVVSGNHEDATETIATIQKAGINVHLRPASGGFTKFILKKEICALLGTG